MICKKCNFQNQESDKFCRNCGTKLIKTPNILNKITKRYWLLIAVGLIVASVSIIILLNKDAKTFDPISDTSIQTNLEVNIKQLVQDWNKAHMSKDIAQFSNLYHNTVLFYGTYLDKNKCIEKKSSLFKKYPDFNHQIYGNIQIEIIDETEIKCSFVKRVTVKQVTTDYPSYLIFKKSDDVWKIIVESDLVTDKYIAKKNAKIPKDAVKGDYNGDGVFDYAWLDAPEIVNPTGEEGGAECADKECIAYIKFSESSIPSIKILNCINGIPDNLGDLNKDGKDEIGLLPGWWSSCWRSYLVWTLKDSQWIYAVEPFSTHCNQWDEGIKAIEIDINKKGYVLIHYSEHTGEEIVTRTKSVPIK